MNKDEITKAIDVAAQDRITKMFDVLCSEILGPNPECQKSAVDRFMRGLRIIATARNAAIAAIEGGDQS